MTRETYVIHTTKQCNMNCLYCYEQDKDSTYSVEETLEHMDNLFKDIGNNIVHIEYLGGEPMLRFDIIKAVYKHGRSKYNKNIENFTITTNGTIVHEELIDFLKEHKDVTFAISMDGTKNANQLRYFKNWKNSYDKVVENIRILHDNNLYPSIHIVTHPYNVAFMFDSLTHLYHDLGVKHIGIGTIESTIVIDEEYVNEFKKQMEKISDYIYDNNLIDFSIDLFNGIKPKEDVRTYVKELNTNKTVFESYGRIENEIFNDTSKYKIIKCGQATPVSEMIYDIRSSAYYYHRDNPKKNKKETEFDKTKKELELIINKIKSYI